MLNLFIPAILILAGINSFAQNSFSNVYGGNGFDRGLYIAHTSDGGYIACGYTRSFGDNYDMYVLKTDAQGRQQWQKNYGNDKWK